MKMTLSDLDRFIKYRMDGKDYTWLGRKFKMSKQNARSKVKFLAEKYKVKFPDLTNMRYDAFIKRLQKRHPEYFRNGRL